LHSIGVLQFVGEAIDVIGDAAEAGRKDIQERRDGGQEKDRRERHLNDLSEPCWRGQTAKHENSPPS
jgi:hypothetical protein